MTAKVIGRLLKEDQPVVLDFGLTTNKIIVLAKGDTYTSDKLKFKDNMAINQGGKPDWSGVTQQQKETYGNSLRAKIVNQVFNNAVSGTTSPSSRDNLSVASS